MLYINHFFCIHYRNVFVLYYISQHCVAVVEDYINIMVLQTEQITSWFMSERFLMEVNNYILVTISQQNGPIIIHSIFGLVYYNSI